jgi:hypothetical protein
MHSGASRSSACLPIPVSSRLVNRARDDLLSPPGTPDGKLDDLAIGDFQAHPLPDLGAPAMPHGPRVASPKPGAISQKIQQRDSPRRPRPTRCLPTHEQPFQVSAEAEPLLIIDDGALVPNHDDTPLNLCAQADGLQRTQLEKRASAAPSTTARNDFPFRKTNMKYYRALPASRTRSCSCNSTDTKSERGNCRTLSGDRNGAKSGRNEHTVSCAGICVGVVRVVTQRRHRGAGVATQCAVGAVREARFAFARRPRKKPRRTLLVMVDVEHTAAAPHPLDWACKGAAHESWPVTHCDCDCDDTYLPGSRRADPDQRIGPHL